MMRSLKIILRSDLWEKGIPWSRQHLNRKIKAGTFPPPDGKTADGPTAPNFRFEQTIDKWLQGRAEALAAKRVRSAIADHSGDH